MFSRLPREYCFRRSPAGEKVMVGRGLEPHPFGLQPSALPVKLTNHKLMSVVGFEPTTSGFVDQRSKFRCATRTKSGWQDSNLRELAPKASGRPLPHILIKMEPAGLEPAISGLQDQRLSSLATAPKHSLATRRFQRAVSAKRHIASQFARCGDCALEATRTQGALPDLSAGFR